MSEHLVVEKSRTQRRVETVAFYALPPAVSFGCVWLSGRPAYWAPLLVLITPLVIAPIGNLYASLIGRGEHITREERLKRLVTRSRGSFAAHVAWATLYWGMLQACALLPIIAPDDLRRHAVAFAILFAGGGLICGVLSAICLRMMRRAVASPSPDMPPQAPMQWLWRRLPQAYLCWTAGAALGLFAARYLPEQGRLIAPGAGILLGMVVDSFIVSGSKRPMMLWHQFSFRQALLTGMLQTGVLYALLVVSMASVFPVGSLEILVLAVMGAGGFVIGTVLTLARWGLARLNDVSPRGAR